MSKANNSKESAKYRTYHQQFIYRSIFFNLHKRISVPLFIFPFSTAPPHPAVASSLPSALTIFILTYQHIFFLQHLMYKNDHATGCSCFKMLVFCFWICFGVFLQLGAKSQIILSIIEVKPKQQHQIQRVFFKACTYAHTHTQTPTD